MSGAAAMENYGTPPRTAPSTEAIHTWSNAAADGDIETRVLRTMPLEVPRTTESSSTSTRRARRWRCAVNIVGPNSSRNMKRLPSP
ncbi:uncharacterized protein BP5553_06178 [Venustampulla echinocandica]|uniref:Uncharacterized protein n=1 Tax=Venustampulla echinocandica TaxID=2656787 RepID=A0A370TMR7_9HELO|nr:uncharacterized protein BP5553_06178 [Venustampulla echinocandica]RDL36826.1 hypothetical protein BP5553_06178 [Venustampulla echinocandica]